MATGSSIPSIFGSQPDDEYFDVVLTNIMFHHLDLAEKRQAVAEIVVSGP
jgi:hypothetical protein